MNGSIVGEVQLEIGLNLIILFIQLKGGLFLKIVYRLQKLFFVLRVI